MPTIQYVRGQPFLVPDEVTELPAGAQPALPVTQDYYPAGYDNQSQAALPAQPDMWAQAARAGKRLFGLGGEERYQTWPERTIRSALTLPAEVYQGTVQSGPGLRREDVTDIPGTAQPLDPLIERAQDVAGLAGGTMFAGVKPGVASLGAGPVRKISKNDLYHGTTIDAAKKIDDFGIEPRIGNFVKKMYGEDANDALVYLADKDGIKSAFTAIKEQVAQKLGKYQSEVTAKDIEDHGVLYAVKKHEYDHYRGTEEGLSRNSKNEIVEETPTGVESGDWYSRDTVLPDKKVTGKKLVDLFKSEGVSLLSETSKVGAPLAALEKAPMFYSNVENAVKASKQNVASKEQWLSYLKNQPGVKPEELEWTVANLPEGKITKQQLEQHIAENKVQLGENWEPTYGGNKKHYEKWQLLGGENYRELTLTLPPKGKDIDLGNEAAALAKSLREQYGERWISQAPKEQVAKYENLIDQASAEDTGKHFKSSHWDEPNVLAHVRMNDRDIPNVGKSLHIEEIQSDWHQQGRKHGYTSNKTNSELDQLYRDVGGKKPTPVPNAPFKKTWDELALKRTINEAVRNGYDAISWTPGEAQAARYDLSKQVNSIEMKPEGVNKHIVINAKSGVHASGLVDKDGKIIQGYDAFRDAVGKPLSDVVGKEMAEKIMAKDNEHKFEGLDLKVGGEGMKAFYDKMIVDKVNNLTKKFGGKVETKDLKNSIEKKIENGEYVVYNNGKEVGRFKNRNSAQELVTELAETNQALAGGKIHVLKLTPELKKAVSEKGFPLFTGGLEFPKPLEQPTFDERWRDRVPDEMMKRDEIKDLLERQKIRNLPLDYTPPERKFEGRPVRLTKIDYTPEF